MKTHAWSARRLFDSILIICALSSCITSPQSAAKSPNIIVITSDDMGFNELGFASALVGKSTQFETPNLDALAQQSVVASSGYAAHSLCSPSRAGLLLGQYQHRVGLQDNLGESINDTQYGLPANAKLISGHLKDLGYTTGMVGKWHVGYAEGVNRPTDMGFDEFFGVLGSGRDYFTDYNPAHGIWRGTQFYETPYRTEGDPAKYDPVKGRYVTDAFGEEVVDFINRHASDADPFFVYAPFTASHTPFGVKQADYDHFANIADPTKRTLAAMTYAFDRSVGDIVAAVNSNGLADNTIIIYANDNGGNNFNDNSPFSGSKGLEYEGSIRVPFLLKLPGVSAGTFDAPISMYDVLPTVYAAAGGDVSQIQTDGVDLKPYLTGQASGSPHETLFWRNLNMYAVRKGDWKLGNLNGGGSELHNLASDPGEKNNLISQEPEKVAELYYDFTAWEAQMGRPMQGGATAVNSFDHFVFRTDTIPNTLWGSENQWFKAGTTEPATLQKADSYANLILEFPVKNGGGYSSYNNRTRSTNSSMILNQIRFTGQFTDSVTSAAFLHGLSLIFVRNLDGQLPRIQLDATSSGTNAKFRFRLYNDLLLFDDLEITGNGTQTLDLGGSIKDFGPPRNVIKSGTSTVNLLGNSTFAGDLRVNQGQVILSGAAASINGANSIVIGSAGSFVQAGGLVAVHSIDNSAGGSFQFNSGELRVVDFLGNLTNQGGDYSPGASPAASTISGNLVQSAPSTKLTMELAGTSPGVKYDQLTIGGSAALGGILQIDLLPGFLQHTGDVYTLLSAAGGITGNFSNTILPALSGGRSWRLVYGTNSLQLVIDPTGGFNGLPGDFDRNGKVDAADYVVWRESVNSTTNLVADSDGDGTVELEDLQVWRASFGNSAPATGVGNSIGIPEPNSVMLAFLASLCTAEVLRRRSATERSRRQVA